MPLLSAKQLVEWQAFYRIEPWGPERADFSAAQICSMIAASAGTSAPPQDFMPHYDQIEREPPSAADLEVKIHTAMIQMGGQIAG